MNKIADTKPNAKPEAQPHEALQSQIQGLLQAGQQQDAMARAIGISPSALSLWLNGKYGADTAKLEAKIVRWLENREEVAAVKALLPEEPAFYQTPTAQLIRGVFQYAQLSGGMGVIYGGAGVCKSSTALNYRDEVPNVFIAMASPATARVSSFLDLVANEMGLTVVSHKPSMLEQAIVAKLKGSRGLLIVDEGQYLPVETLYQLTMIRERARVGIVILGNEAIYGRMKAGFAQLYSRVGKRLRLQRPTLGDLDAALRAWEKALALPGDALNGEIRDFFWGSKDALGPARRDGGLRNVSETIKLACFLSGGANEALSLRSIRAAWKDLSVEGVRA